MSSWTPRTVYNGIEYGGNHQQYWWDENLNPGATFTIALGTYDYALPNCTTYCWGRILEAGDPVCIKVYDNKRKKGMFGGLAVITDYPIEAPYDDSVTYSLTFSGMGKLTDLTVDVPESDVLPS